MVRGDRADGVELALRINAAADLVASGISVATAAQVLAVRFGVSVRQARRYVGQAMAGRVEVPEASVVFTVKLPGSLAERVRAAARADDATISSVVAAALDAYLSDKGPSTPPR